MQTPHQNVHPALLEAAKHSGVLRRMIREGLPLTREQWIRMAYLGHPPQPWTTEHEEEVPEPFQRPLHDS
jgi:hypothetical protein